MDRSRYTAIMQRLLAWKQTQASKRFAGNRGPNPAFNPFESLPMELLQMVLDELDHVSLVCLRNTSSGFRAVVPPIESKDLSRCQKWLIMCRFETDMREYPALVACAFCKVKRPQKDFGPSDKRRHRHGQAKTNSDCRIGIRDMMNAKPARRYCYRHTESSLGWPPAFRTADKIKWVRTFEPTCLHCGSKPASCGQTAAKLYDAPSARLSCCDRPCDTCPRLYLQTFLRHGPIQYPCFTTAHGRHLWCFRVTFGGKWMILERKGKNEFHSSR